MKHWVLGIAAMTLPVFGSSRCDRDKEPTHNVKIENQHWAQRAPKDARDMVNWLSIVDNADKYGAAQRRSAYRWIGEAFLWRRDSQKLTLSFPQSNRKVTLEVKPYPCSHDIFDRCLDVTWKGRTVTLYSMEDLRIRDGGGAAPLSPSTMDDAGCPSCTEGLPASLEWLFDEAPAQ